MMVHVVQRNVLSPCLESVAVDAEAVVARQCHEVASLPRAAALLHTVLDGLGLLFQSFGLQGTHPTVYHQPCEVGDNLVTGGYWSVVSSS